MFIKFLKSFLFTLLIFNQTSLYSKNNNKNEFNSKDLSNYFSAQVSYDNERNNEALKFFKLSRSLIDKHDPFLKQYIFSLVLEGDVKKAIRQSKLSLIKESSSFYEAYLLLTIDSLKRGDLKKTTKYINDLSRYKDNGALELIIYETLRDFNYLFKNKKIPLNKSNFGNLTLIAKAFQSCYLNKENTNTYFINLINSDEIDYSRYIFFYISYLIEQSKFTEAKQIIDQVDLLNTNLLTAQTKKWIDKKELKKFDKFFSCKKESDIISEFFFLIASLYSSQNDFEESNFYLNISNFLNPNFKFNLSLLAENYYKKKNYKKSKKILNLLNDDNKIYYWYKIKKKANIIFKESDQENSINYINLNFEKIKNPSTKILFDMANIAKGFKKYEVAINYYNKVLSRLKPTSLSYPDILYRRGGSYERLNQFKNSDDDLLNSLKIAPDNAYVLNYLAYSWLERNYKIETAILMLEKAYQQKKNDPFIIDSVGWAYYLMGNLIKAEKFLQRAIKLMPNDPVVNDHYGDILWKLDRKIQARYYWNSVLNFENSENEMKKNINIKLLKGLQKS